MNKNKINSLQFGSLILCPILSASLGIGLYNAIQIAKVDSYIGIFISSILGIIPLLLIIYISKFEEDKNIIEKINILYGKYIGTFINFIIVSILFVIGITILFGICNFIVTQFLANTPIMYVGIMFGIVCVYSVSKGIETISRTQFIFTFIITIIFITLAASLYPEFDKSNLKPFLEYGINSPLKVGILNLFTNIIPIFIILIIPKENICDKEKYTKFVIIFYIISILFILLISIFTIGVLGQYLASFYQYPEYILLKKVNLFGFIDRIENILSIGWILSTYATLTLIIYYISNFIKKNDKSKLSPLIITSLIILTSLFIFKNNTTFNMYITNIYPYIISILFVIMIIICITIIIKKKINYNN